MADFDISLASKGLKTKYLGRRIVYKPVTATTMDDAENGARHGNYIASRWSQTRYKSKRGAKQVSLKKEELRRVSSENKPA